MARYASLIWLFLLQTSFAEDAVFTSQEFNSFFQSVWVEDNKLCLRFSNELSGLAHPTGDGRGEIIHPGETVKMPFAEKTKLVERHSGIIFDPIPAPLNADGFSITSYFDSTSAGGSRTEKRAFLVKVPKNSNAPPELRWLPPDTSLTEIAAIIHGQESKGQPISSASIAPTVTVHPPDSSGSSPDETARSAMPVAPQSARAELRRYALWAGGGFIIAVLLIYFWKKSP